MSEAPRTNPADGHDPPRLREFQLKLTLEVDRLIIAGTTGISEILQFIVKQAHRRGAVGQTVWAVAS